jgi:hypothetical protein
MTRWTRSRLSFANVMSIIAVFIALGGTSYAAIKIPKNSVSSSQIKTGAVASSDVKDGALKKVDFKASDLPIGPTGPQGLQGAKGDKGADGTKGATGTIGAVTVQTTAATADLAPSAKVSLNAKCPDGQQAIGGGGRGDDTQSQFTNVGSSRPAVSTSSPAHEPPAAGQGFDEWRLTVDALSTAPAGIRPQVWVMCAAAPTP